jgi:hypothetical protein
MKQIKSNNRQFRQAILWIGLLVAGTALAVGLNDTGQTTCYDDSIVASPEPSTHPRQDCRVGRDAAAATEALPKTGAGDKGFDYTKIANDGSLLPASAELGSNADQWACTRDNLSQLTWEVKTHDRGLRDREWNYAWYDDLHPDNNGGDPGVRGRSTCGETLPNGQCNTQAYIAAVNAIGLCGHKDWRAPTRKELYGLVDKGISNPGPTLDNAYFPNTLPSAYWSSSTYAGHPAVASNVNFSMGLVSASNKDQTYPVRLVRGGL